MHSFNIERHASINHSANYACDFFLSVIGVVAASRRRRARPSDGRPTTRCLALCSRSRLACGRKSRGDVSLPTRGCPSRRARLRRALRRIRDCLFIFYFYFQHFYSFIFRYFFLFLVRFGQRTLGELGGSGGGREGLGEGEAQATLALRRKTL